jgi:quinolinate synthase
MGLGAERLESVPAHLDLDREIERLKRERNAVLLAHYYQESEIQDLADCIGDSLQLAQAAEKSKADVIAFAGVHFMAETAKILNPERIVVVPDLKAGCSLADGCPVERFKSWKARYPGAVAISYVNCSAAVKAESDYICTSSNARKILDAIPRDKQVLFAPDRNLGKWLIKETGRELVLWPGSCIVHETFSQRKLLMLKAQHPRAKVIAHPECDEAVLELADYIGSTSALLKFVETDGAEEFIVVTESGILHQMEKKAKKKKLIPAPPSGSCGCNECPYMRLNTPQKLYLALRDLQPRIELDEELRRRAKLPIDRMLALS